jgi:hypothetical protein
LINISLKLYFKGKVVFHKAEENPVDYLRWGRFFLVLTATSAGRNESLFASLSGKS